MLLTHPKNKKGMGLKDEPEMVPFQETCLSSGESFTMLFVVLFLTNMISKNYDNVSQKKWHSWGMSVGIIVKCMFKCHETSTMPWNIHHLKMHFLMEKDDYHCFHCYVGLPNIIKECNIQCLDT